MRARLGLAVKILLQEQRSVLALSTNRPADALSACDDMALLLARVPTDNVRTRAMAQMAPQWSAILHACLAYYAHAVGQFSLASQLAHQQAAEASGRHDVSLQHHARLCEAVLLMQSGDWSAAHERLAEPNEQLASLGPPLQASACIVHALMGMADGRSAEAKYAIA